jgi:hypothetical protein
MLQLGRFARIALVASLAIVLRLPEVAAAR